MRVGRRGQDRVKRSVRDRAESVGLVVAVVGFLYMTVGAVFGLGVEPLLTAQRDHAILSQLVGGRPALTSDAEGPVILRGRIDPNQPVALGGGGLALVKRESWRSNSTWDWELIHHPEFDLLLENRSVRVVNGCRRQEKSIAPIFKASDGPGTGLDDCYRLGGTWVMASDGTGHRRYFGFRPGDEVHVVGTLHDSRLHATSVFGGSPEDYAAMLRNSRWPLGAGLVIGLALLAMSLIMGYVFVRIALWRGSPAEKAARGPAGESTQDPSRHERPLE